MNEVILFHEGLFSGGEELSIPFAPGDYARNCRQDYIEGWFCLRRSWPNLPGFVYVCGLCSSSLDVAHAIAGKNLLPVWSSVLALGQTAGRGQLGRSWHSGFDNMFTALRLPPAKPFAGPEAAPALGALLAVALRDCGYHVLLKWPNDIVVSTPGGTLRKAGGILLEERHGCLIAGIGLNLASTPPPSALREGHALPGERLSQAGIPPTPLALWLELVTRIKFWYDQSLHADTLCDFATHWHSLAESFLAWRGQEVGVTDGPDDAIHLRGIVCGLGPDGGLRLRVGETIHTVHSGSLVRL